MNFLTFLASGLTMLPIRRITMIINPIRFQFSRIIGLVLNVSGQQGQRIGSGRSGILWNGSIDWKF